MRIIDLPQEDEIDEFDIRKRFRLGLVYELPIQLAATLIIIGYAERVSGDVRAEAADRGLPRKPSGV